MSRFESTHTESYSSFWDEVTVEISDGAPDFFEREDESNAELLVASDGSTDGVGESAEEG